MTELETRLHAPEASASEIMKAVEHLLPLNLFPTPGRDEALNGTIRIRLEEIAAQSESGLVPIHGRMFAQWLHYAFPRDCPYPHEMGLINPMTPAEYIEAAGKVVGGSDDPTVVLDSDLDKLEKDPHTLLPPSPHAGAKMWKAKEELLISSTALDNWIGICLRSLAGMLLMTGLLVTILKSIRHLRKVLSTNKAAKAAK